MKRSLQRKLLIAAILGIASIVASGLMSMKGEPPERDIDVKDPLVEVFALEPIDGNFAVRSQGTVRPRTESILSAEVSGTITAISPDFVAGGRFEAGDVLLRIDPTNYEVAVSQAQALVRQRQIEYDGAAELRSQGYRAESEYASSVAALASAQAALVRAERDLERTYIRLPYAGIVRSKDTDIGQFVSPGSRLGVAFATDMAEVRLPLTDMDLAFVDLPASSGVDGPSVTLSATQRGQTQQWQATIVRTEGVVDESSRVTYAVARIDDPYRRTSDGEPLPMGTFVTASIQGSSLEGIVRVPLQAIRGSNQLLFVDDESRVRIQVVDVVRSDSDYAYIRGDAHVGERIALTPLETQVDGMAVRTADDPVEEGGEGDSPNFAAGDGGTAQ